MKNLKIKFMGIYFTVYYDEYEITSIHIMQDGVLSEDLTESLNDNDIMSIYNLFDSQLNNTVVESKLERDLNNIKFITNILG